MTLYLCLGGFFIQTILDILKKNFKKKWKMLIWEN